MLMSALLESQTVHFQGYAAANKSISCPPPLSSILPFGAAIFLYLMSIFNVVPF
jgi:hypothetical protein